MSDEKEQAMTDDERNRDDETDEGQDAQGTEGDQSAEAGPPEDIENDPAYDPDDENLKGIKGG
jgi:hypothetical protein